MPSTAAAQAASDTPVADAQAAAQSDRRQAFFGGMPAAMQVHQIDASAVEFMH